MDMPIDYRVWGAMLERYQRHMPKLSSIMLSERLFCQRYRMISFTSSVIRQLYHFATEFDCLLMQQVDNVILKTLCLNTERAIGS